jgi:hypothetical protein
MSRLSATTRWVLMLAVLTAALPVPLNAALSADAFSAQLLTTRDQVAKSLGEWHGAARTKTDTDFAGVKDKLAETWTTGRKKAVTAAAAALDKQRQAITDELAGDPERLDRVSKKLKELFDARVKALGEAGDKFDAAAKAFVLPTSGEVKQQALDKFDELTKAALEPVSDAEWGKVFEAAKAAFAEPTAADRVNQAAEAVKDFTDRVEKDFARIVKCKYSATPAALLCEGNLAVSAAEISTIEVSGLPHDKQVIVSASAAKDAPTADEPNDGMVDPESDFVVLGPGEADKVSVDVHLSRGFKPTYEEGFKHPIGDPPRTAQSGDGDRQESDRRVVAAWSLRWTDVPRSGRSLANDPNQGRDRLILIVSGRAPQITVKVKIDDGKDPGELVSAALELGYARWGIDTGGFYALSWLSDEQLKTEPIAGTDMVKITRRGGGSDLSPDTGIFLNLVPKNYPIFGVGLGFSANKDQPNTFYLGGSLRLLSFRNAGVASFSAGATVRSVKRFPGLDENMMVSKTDPKLQGTTQLKVAPYLVVQLGFSFGRIPGAKNAN